MGEEKNPYEQLFEEEIRRGKKSQKGASNLSGKFSSFVKADFPKLPKSEQKVYQPIAGLQEFFITPKLLEKIVNEPINISAQKGKKAYEIGQMVVVNANRQQVRAKIMDIKAKGNGFELTLEGVTPDPDAPTE